MNGLMTQKKEHHRRIVQMTKKYCAVFPCRNYAEPGSSRCHEHDLTPAVKEVDPFYLSVKWRRFRDSYHSRHPLCEVCESEGRVTPAVMVDHIVELRDGGAPTSDDNAMSMCWKCHGIKTASEQNKRKNRQVAKKDNRVGSQAES
jgi:5-methylcytosine-specific restriction enzyme A